MTAVLKKWRPRVLMALLALAGVGLCARLSFWQYERGQEKAAIEASRLQAGLQVPVPRADLDPASLPTDTRVQPLGQWEHEHTLLLDNQTKDGRIGVHVWTLFRLQSGKALMVDRGWTPAPLDRTQPIDLQPPPHAEPRGILRTLPEAGIVTANRCAPSALPRLNYPTHADLRCLYGDTVLPALLLLDPDLPGHYLRQWQRFEMRPEKHYAYSFQWAALAVAIAVVYLTLNRRRKPEIN